MVGEEELLPQALMVMVTPLSMARMAASVNSRRSSIGSIRGFVFMISFTSLSQREQALCRAGNGRGSWRSGPPPSPDFRDR